MYYSLFPSAQPVSGPWVLNWVAYLKQNHYNTDASGGTSSDPRLAGGCTVAQNDPAGQAYMMDTMLKQWARDKSDTVDAHWNGLPVSAAPAEASTAAPAAPAVAASGGGYFMSCSTSGGAGIDTYYTGVFPIKTAKRSPNGFWGSPESQPALDKFYAYLTQKGYTFKPGSSSGCDIGNTEAAAQAAQHKRAYEGGGCPTCGKIVETGWKP